MPRGLQQRDFPDGIFLARHLSLGGSGGIPLPQFTTTDTTQWVTAYWTTIYVPAVHLVVRTPFVAQWKHSAANAKAGIYAALYDTPDLSGLSHTSFAFGDKVGNEILINGGIANAWEPIPGPGALDAELSNIGVGIRALFVGVRNYTVGTLTLAGGSGFDFISWGFEGK